MNRIDTKHYDNIYNDPINVFEYDIKDNNEDNKVAICGKFKCNLEINYQNIKSYKVSRSDKYNNKYLLIDVIDEQNKKISHIKYNNNQYNLKQIILFVPARHRINNTPLTPDFNTYKMEIVFINEHTELDNRIISISSFIETDLEQSNISFFPSFNYRIPDLGKIKNKNLLKSTYYDLNNLIPDKKTFYTYMSNCNTSGCMTELIIFDNPIKIDSALYNTIFNKLFIGGEEEFEEFVENNILHKFNNDVRNLDIFKYIGNNENTSEYKSDDSNKITKSKNLILNFELNPLLYNIILITSIIILYFLYFYFKNTKYNLSGKLNISGIFNRPSKLNGVYNPILNDNFISAIQKSKLF
jgi:carbonic anhydrase